MSFELNAVFSLSIVVSVIIGWVRFAKTDPAFLPFLLYLSFGFINEAIGISLAYRGYTNVISYNVFGLVETVLLTWQFLKWGLFGQRKGFYYFLQSSFLFLWMAESFFVFGTNLQFLLCHFAFICTGDDEHYYDQHRGVKRNGVVI